MWARVTETVTPLSNSNLSKSAQLRGSAREQRLQDSPQTRNIPSPQEDAPRAPVPKFRVGSRARPDVPRHDIARALPDALRAAPSRVDGRTHTRLKRGKLRPEARIDLHGMTLAQAHPMLARFLMAAHGDGKRLVLVITGKGKDRDDDGVMPVRRGVLRHQVPHWISLPPLAQIVLQVTPAHLRHGGDGAYYIYLRRQR
jgi:DNA-nicking Smr family endonuclease